MLRGVLARFTARFSGGEGATDEEGDGRRFIPSVLDASVRYAHGGNNPGERELINMQEEAQELEEQRQQN